MVSTISVTSRTNITKNSLVKHNFLSRLQWRSVYQSTWLHSHWPTRNHPAQTTQENPNQNKNLRFSSEIFIQNKPYIRESSHRVQKAKGGGKAQSDYATRAAGAPPQQAVGSRTGWCKTTATVSQPRGRERNNTHDVDDEGFWLTHCWTRGRERGKRIVHLPSTNFFHIFHSTFSRTEPAPNQRPICSFCSREVQP